MPDHFLSTTSEYDNKCGSNRFSDDDDNNNYNDINDRYHVSPKAKPS